MRQYDVSWSGGKDSTASIILAHEHNIPIHAINYVRLMYNKYIPVELPIMVDFINKAKQIFEKWGYKVNIIKAKHTAVDFMFCTYKKSPHQDKNGHYYGCTNFLRLHCAMTGEKQRSLKSSYPQIVGIASDEIERLKKIKTPNFSILAQYNVKEKDSYEICKKYNLLSPLYDIPGFSRGGCFFCPNIRKKAILYLKNYEPKLYNLSLQMVEICKYNLDKQYNYSNWIKEFYKVRYNNGEK